MYIAAVIRNRAGELINVRATAKCDIIFPLDMASKAVYALATNKLLASYLWQIKPYANKDHAIVRITTDNFMLMDRFSKNFETHYVPEGPEGVGDAL